LQAVLNTLTERLPRCVKNGRSAENITYARTGTTLRVMVAISPEVSFEQNATPVPEIMDASLYVFHNIFYLLSMFEV
jgi:hypothetical protein